MIVPNRKLAITSIKTPITKYGAAKVLVNHVIVPFR